MTESFILRILSGRRVWSTINNLYEFLWTILLSWISVLYLLVGRFILAKAFFVSTSRCNSCGICADNCPVEAIRMIGRNKPKPYWQHNCQSCMRCMSYCPTKAIEASQQLIAFLSYVCFLPFSVFVSRWLAGFIPGFRASAIPYLPFVINLACIYAAIFLSYVLFYALSRVPWLNTVLVFTTGTRYYRRYYYPGTKLQELSGRNVE
jgi:NAD-dependent dihydropyrimidine dehydrogenase PreA subunit